MRPQPNVFHGAALVTVAGLIMGLALKPAPKDPDPRRDAPAATAPAPVEIAHTGPTPWWVTGSDALYGRPDTRMTLARADAPEDAPPAEIEVYPAALEAPAAAAVEPRYAQASVPPRAAGGEWREDAEGVYFVPEDETYPSEPADGYDPYA